MSRRGSQKRPVTVAIAVGDPGLASRLAKAIGIHADLEAIDRTGAADILIVKADQLGSIDRPEAAIVVLGEGVVDTLGTTPRAILPADADPALVAGAVRLVARGLLVLPESALDPGATAERDDEEDPPAVEQVQLTPREREVLELLAAGASNKVIARRLQVSVHTAKFHVASLFRKLGASGRLEAVGIGLRTGLLMV